MKFFLATYKFCDEKFYQKLAIRYEILITNY